MQAKANEQGERSLANGGPRLVKASEFEARRVAKEEEQRARTAPAAANLATVRAPRSADEARDMFASLFEAA